MRQSDELPLEQVILAQTSCSHAHTALNVAVKLSLGIVVFLEVGDELLRRVGELKLLGLALECRPSFKDLLLGGLSLKVYEYSRSVTVRNGYAVALSGDDGSVSLDDLTVLNLTPDLEGLLLALFLFAADVGNDVVYDLGELLKVLPAPEIA